MMNNLDELNAMSHVGVLGMKWGRRKSETSNDSGSSRKVSLGERIKISRAKSKAKDDARLDRKVDEHNREMETELIEMFDTERKRAKAKGKPFDEDRAQKEFTALSSQLSIDRNDARTIRRVERVINGIYAVSVLSTIGYLATRGY